MKRLISRTFSTGISRVLATASVRRRRRHAWRSKVAHAHLAQGNERSPESAFRRSRAHRQWTAATIGTRAWSACPAKRSGSSASVQRAEVLSGQPPARGRPQGAGRDDQGALDLRAGAQAAQRRTRPRPLRGPLAARPPRNALITMIAYAFLQHRRLAAASGKRRISADPPQPRLPAIRPRSRAPRLFDARTAAGKSQTTHIQSAKGVLV
jgi:hypothetical protein